METVLEFLDNQANENEGLGDAGIETFKDTPYASAAKEAGQNSRDAMVDKPIKVTFALHEISAKEIPCHAALGEAVDACLERVEAHPDEKEEDFFKKARNVLAKEKMKVLEISDYNTTGLVGPVVEGKPFYALLKGSGVSNKGGDGRTSSGSFGIGKNASFAISDLQAVFYSTIYKDEAGASKYLAQGKVKLVSHVDKDGKARKATGWWGLPNFKEIDDAAFVPAWMRRSEPGTSVFALGFREEKNWEYRVVAALLRTFFAAIHKGEMEFEVGAHIKINQSNVYRHFHDDRVVNAAAEGHAQEEFEFARDLFKCLTQTEVIRHEVRIPDAGGTAFGRIELRILMEARLPKRIGFIRNGMMITDNLKHFNHPFRLFPRSSDFIALAQPLDPAGSALLKKLENPPHDQFSADRIADDTKREEAHRIMDVVGKLIRNKIREVTRSIPKDEEAISELAEFFARDPDETLDDQGEEGVSKFKYELRRDKPAKPPQRGNESGETGGSGEREGEGRGGDGLPGEGPGGGPGKKGGNRRFPISDDRNIEISKTERRLMFTADADGRARLVVEAGGMSSGEVLEIESVSAGAVEDNSIILEVEQGVRVIMSIRLKDDYEGPLELLAYEMSEAINEN